LSFLLFSSTVFTIDEFSFSSATYLLLEISAFSTGFAIEDFAFSFAVCNFYMPISDALFGFLSLGFYLLGITSLCL